MANLVRLLKQWPTLHPLFFAFVTPHHFMYSTLVPVTKAVTPRLSLTGVPSAHRSVHHRSRGLRLPNAPIPSDLEEGGASDSDSDVRKSRNQLKRQARRAVRWGMELASFSTPQIKRILRVASLDQEVFEALMLVKKLGPDVREGKRRQFNYIGKLLREVQPELMDELIQATKDGDQSRLQALSGSVLIGEDDEEAEESEYEEEEGSDECINMATRWCEGLISKDIKITNEVYSIRSVEFDRQELRKLVRKVHSIQERQATTEENEKEADAAVMAARKSLTRFLLSLAKHMPSD
ncbi:hypothetical protein I3760_08G068500 [Carya illinoinensis]|uniref:Uncharacterized protein n=1 Tax=Carya illinoinensis TaxID=32201 RepID=A0A8T1PS47_CARIL|nr:uncharacterized protein LOC122317957 [Carya illinoinensis]KAG2692789.1 hypothetical protein I3760_08G068500 [Carya illinoinensis]KAG6644644.1 hypothetical protein CIPAW_08G066800 [Carya illinoinensis]